MKKEQPLTQQRLRELFSYDPETGNFTRRLAVSKCQPGEKAGWLCGAGYLEIRVDCRRYLAHRLVWLYVFGRWPSHHIDHLNLEKTDNRLANLREATKSQNHANRPRPRNNRSGSKGVSVRKSGNWSANITINGVGRCLGTFKSRDEATAAYKGAAEELFGEFARADCIDEVNQ
jgi:hypothetical protein